RANGRLALSRIEIWRLARRDATIGAAGGERFSRRRGPPEGTEGKGKETQQMAKLRLTRREALMSAAGSAAATKRAVAPFNWLFGFTVQANPSMPVIVAKELGYYDTEDIKISWDFTTDSTSIRLIGSNQYQAGSVSDVLTVANFVQQGIPLVAIVQQGQNSARAFAVKQG